MIHQHWVAASLFTVFVVHGAEPPPADPQGHEEITGGAFNETGDLFLTSFGHIFPGSQAPVGPPIGPQVGPPVAGIPFCSLLFFWSHTIPGNVTNRHQPPAPAASNETGDFSSWLPMNISLNMGKRLEVCLVCLIFVLTPVPHTRWSHVLIWEILPIVNWWFFILTPLGHISSAVDLNANDDVEGHNNLVISDLGFWFYIIQGNGTNRQHPPAPVPAKDPNPNETAETGDFSYCEPLCR